MRIGSSPDGGTKDGSASGWLIYKATPAALMVDLGREPEAPGPVIVRCEADGILCLRATPRPAGYPN